MEIWKNLSKIAKATGVYTYLLSNKSHKKIDTIDNFIPFNCESDEFYKSLTGMRSKTAKVWRLTKVLEEIPGIYEQLTPLLFHFTEKPAENLQRDNCLQDRSSCHSDFTWNHFWWIKSPFNILERCRHEPTINKADGRRRRAI